MKTYSDADLARIVDAVKANPGKRPSQVQAVTKLKANVFAAAVKKLKVDGTIRVKGKARGTHYEVA